MKVFFPAADERRLIQEFFGAGPGYFVDVGANHPTVESQTYHLEQMGWDGLLIEPQPDLAEALRAGRKAKVAAVACSAPGNSGRLMPMQLAGIYSSLNRELSNAKATATSTINVPVTTLDNLLSHVQAPSPIDFLSIDVEGHEIEVLQGFDFQRWRPRLLLIEDLVLDRRLHKFLLSSGYHWMRRTSINSWYVPEPRTINLSGRLKFFRKYYIGVPFRRFRQISRRARRRLGLIRKV